MVTLWSFDGDQLTTCSGHSTFVFTVDFIDFGKCKFKKYNYIFFLTYMIILIIIIIIKWFLNIDVSGGDDRIVKVWNDTEVA